jgi:uncharacterized protein YndB with AHSA1/START domain
MSPVIHGTFAVERDLDAPPPQVFQAFADPQIRTRWFRMPGTPEDARHDMDFRVGGYERASGIFAPMGTEVTERLSYNSTFMDIAADERLVFTYDVSLDGIRRWTSLVTIELAALSKNDGKSDGDGTRLTRTEQYAYLTYAADGQQDIAHIKGSATLHLNALAAALTKLRQTQE